MSLSTIIANVILKILEAFGIKPRSPETVDPAKVSKDSLGHNFVGWMPVFETEGYYPNRCIDCHYSAVVLRHHKGKDWYRYHCQRCLKTGPTANTIRGAWTGWNLENPLPGTPLPKADPAGSDSPAQVPPSSDGGLDLDPSVVTATRIIPGSLPNTQNKAGHEGPLINHVPRPLDDANFGGLSTAGNVATEPAPILLPEATDPTDAPDWLDDKYGAYDPNWKQK